MSNPRLASSHRTRSRFRDAGERISNGVTWVGRLLRRDPISTFLLAGSIAILIAFFSLLGSLGPEGTGQKAPLSTLAKLAEARRLQSATLLDYDHQAWSRHAIAGSSSTPTTPPPTPPLSSSSSP